MSIALSASSVNNNVSAPSIKNDILLFKDVFGVRLRYVINFSSRGYIVIRPAEGHKVSKLTPFVHHNNVDSVKGGRTCLLIKSGTFIASDPSQHLTHVCVYDDANQTFCVLKNSVLK